MSIQAVPIDIEIPHLVKQVKNAGKDITIFDLETTTLGGPTFGITECATLTVGGEGAPILRVSLVNPENPISWQAEQKTGIHWAMVRNKPSWGQAWGLEMIHLCKESQTAGWGSKSFDIHRMQGEQRRYKLPELPFEDHLDAYHIACRLRGEKKGNLSETAEAMNIPWTSAAHRAPADVIMTALVLNSLAEKYGIDAVFNYEKPEKIKKVLTKKNVVKIDDLDLVNAAKSLQEYDAKLLANFFMTDTESIERQLSDLVKDGCNPEPFSCRKTQTWLKEVLPDILPTWGEKRLLRELMTSIKKHPLSRPDITYLQIRVGLANISNKVL